MFQNVDVNKEYWAPLRLQNPTKSLGEKIQKRIHKERKKQPKKKEID